MAVCFNHTVNRQAVFRCRQSHRSVLPRYLLLVARNGVLAYGGIRAIHGRCPAISILGAKLLVETTLFLGNFLIQRGLIFGRRPAPH